MSKSINSYHSCHYHGIGIFGTVAWPQADAIEAIKTGAGTQFDPQVVDTFIDLLENGELDEILSLT